MSEAERARVLVEALPYFRRYHGKTVVVKYGGAAMVQEDLKQQVMADIVLMHIVGIRPVLVHGGGPEVSEAMKKIGKEPLFVRGLRVTDEETVRIAEMVLAGTTNKGIVSLIHQHGGRAVGLSGKDGNLLVARKMEVEGADLGFVGEVIQVNTHLVETLLHGGYVPVISSIAVGSRGETFNSNADHVAGQLAAALRAEKLLLLTDVRGILADVQDANSLLSHLSLSQARELVETGAVDRGMIPKVEACLMAVEGGVPGAHILDGRAPHSLLTELFTDQGVGTMVTRAGDSHSG
ncbi:MAG: acetylglutamate kinase [Armatimonadetes bacterium]|nr:acetylglutamate kinase [Armatimonadota bacterium]